MEAQDAPLEQFASTVFNFAMDKGSPGISPITNKLARFNQVLPLIKAGKIHFPEELKKSIIIGEFISELELATASDLKSKYDDAIDTISMLMYMNPYKPSDVDPITQNNDGMWETNDPWDNQPGSPLSSYIV